MDNAQPIPRGRGGIALGVALLAVALALAARQATAHHYVTGEDSACHISQALDCDKVLASPYALLGGVSVATLAAASNLILAAWIWGAGRGSRTALRAAGLLALADAVGALVFFSIATFVIGATCLYCAGIQLCGLALGVLLVPPAWRARGGTWNRRALAACTLVAATISVLAAAGEAWAGQRSELLRLDTRRNDVALRVDTADSLLIGDPTTPQSILLYFDFGCPYCKRCYRKVREAVARAPTKRHAILKHFPLDRDCNPGVSTRHPGACLAARAGQAAALLGKSRRGADAIFEMAPTFYPQKLADLYEELGVTKAEWERVIASRAVERQVRADIAEGVAMGFTQVPMTYVDGRYVDPAHLERRLR